jgi:hypothetical protein
MCAQRSPDGVIEKVKIEENIADEGNIPGSSSSLIGVALVIAAVIIGLGLIYLSTEVPAAALGVLH